jgi:hypothetical protein
VRLTISLLVEAKYFGCVVCRFHVAAGAELRPDRRINKLSRASPSQLASTFGSGFFLLLVRLNLSFILRETCRCAHHTFLLGFATGWLSTANHLRPPLPPLSAGCRRSSWPSWTAAPPEKMTGADAAAADQTPAEGDRRCRHAPELCPATPLAVAAGGEEHEGRARKVRRRRPGAARRHRARGERARGFFASRQLEANL